MVPRLQEAPASRLCMNPSRTCKTIRCSSLALGQGSTAEIPPTPPVLMDYILRSPISPMRSPPSRVSSVDTTPC
jgi:hypothetical protein